MKVAITSPNFGLADDTPLQRLNKAGLDVVTIAPDDLLAEHEIVKHICGCAGVIAGHEQYTAAVLEALPFLKVIARCDNNLEGIDVQAAEKKGITVFASENSHVRPTVEYIAGALLNVLRGIALMSSEVHKGTWRQRAGGMLAGRRLGLIGLGKVGKAVAETFSQLGCMVSFHDPLLDGAHTLSSGASLPNLALEDLLRNVDIVSLHCPYDKKAGPVLTDSRLKLMAQGGIVVNTAHGMLIDEPSLYAALNTGHLSGAIIDVFAQEPYTGPLSELDTALLTPRVAGLTWEVQRETEMAAVNVLLSALGISLE